MASGQLGKVLLYLRTALGTADADALTDSVLLERFVRHREEEAFAALVERHGPMVHGVCLRVLDDTHEAEDAFQATFLVLARKAETIRKRESVGSWLYGIAYRTALRARAVAARRPACEPEADAMSLDDPAAEAAWRELRPVLDAELERLPEKYRAPVVLCYLQGKTNEQAARQLGWTKGTVSGRLARARDLLRGRLQRRGVALSSGLLVTLLTHHGASASLPPALTAATVRAATLGAAGQAVAAGVVSGQAAALVEGVLQTMVVSKAKVTAVLLLAGALCTAGAGFTYRALGAGPGDEASKPSSTPPAQAKQQPKLDEEQLRRENDRLREELVRARIELEKARAELLLLKRQAHLERDRAEALRRQAEAARLEAEQQRRAALEAEAIAREQAERARRAAEQALAAEREARARAAGAAARAQSANNLKHLAIAVHNYHDVHGCLPPAAVTGKDGKPLLSWRVLLLPYLDQEDLYKQFKLDEPWDSPHNKTLLGKIPPVFGPVTGQDREAHWTSYRVFTGKGTLFEEGKKLSLVDIPDGTSNTILMVEAAGAVPWTKPEELPYDAGQPLPKLGGRSPEGFHAALADGSVHFLRRDFDPRIFGLAITRDDGQAVNIQKLTAPGGAGGQPR